MAGCRKQAEGRVPALPQLNHLREHRSGGQATGLGEHQDLDRLGRFYCYIGRKERQSQWRTP